MGGGVGARVGAGVALAAVGRAVAAAVARAGCAEPKTGAPLGLSEAEAEADAVGVGEAATSGTDGRSSVSAKTSPAAMTRMSATSVAIR